MSRCARRPSRSRPRRPRNSSGVDGPNDSRVLLIGARRHADARGWFSETFVAPRLKALGIACDFPQDNMSLSREAGTIRGLHFQRPPSAQAKLISCLRGRIFDVVVDVRTGSPSYGRSLTVELTDGGEQLFVPVGFAHGFMTLTDDAIVAYKVSGLYDPSAEGGLVWNDPALAIDWPTPARGPTLSDRDAALPRLSELDIPFEYEGGGPLTLERA
ncbi:MAG: dTDP-4-dehydrorhamnose 3,5-epimerase [Alphaproteobacteria bacterium]|nr:dTDP-4-dehydrorhamnose 3,5-epimerase [Alphaproteobacteria bacterium]MBU2378918.1 dTDP-4-dehydrorhamnose 3,5-epimerase [Alphaproteobacteria bacterium]